MNCVNCSKLFEKVHKGQLFCNILCFNEWLNKNKIQIYEIKERLKELDERKQ